MLKKYIRTSGALSVLASAALFFAVSCTQTVPDPVAPPPPPAPETVAPVFTTQPADISVAVGANALFTAAVNADAYPVPTFQWQVSTNGNDWTNITGATSVTYSWVSVAVGDDGSQVRCQAIGSVTVTSDPAILTVTGGVVETPPHAGQTKIFELTGTNLNVALAVNQTYGWANNLTVTGAPAATVGDLVTVVIAGTTDTEIPTANGGLKAMIVDNTPSWSTLAAWDTATMVPGPVAVNGTFDGQCDLTVATAGDIELCQVTYGTGTTGSEPSTNLTLTKFQIWKD